MKVMGFDMVNKFKIRPITSNRRTNLINAIQEYFEDNDEMGEWAQGFLEDIQEKLIQGDDLTELQYFKLLEFVEV